MNLLQRPCSNCLCHLILKSCLSYKILNNETHGLMRAIHHHMPFMDNATNVSNKFTTTTAVKAINFPQKVEVFKLLTIIQQLNQVINYSQQSQRVNNHTPRPPPPGKRGMTSSEREMYKDEHCQLCGRPGHIAKICWSQPNHPINNEDLPQAFAAHYRYISPRCRMDNRHWSFKSYDSTLRYVTKSQKICWPWFSLHWRWLMISVIFTLKRINLLRLCWFVDFMFIFTLV